jgi:prepilin-type N-terminal cleavage/methylation domain-containing protein
MIQNEEQRLGLHGPGESGFTLIETIITLLVLAIAALGILSLFATGIQGSASPLLTSQAAQLAQGEINEIIGERMASGFEALPQGAAACTSTMMAGFTCSRSICYVSAGNLEDISNCAVATTYKRAQVTITITATGTSMNVVTLLTNY